MSSPRDRRFPRIPFFLVLIMLLVGCKGWSQRGAKGLGTLPSAPPGETNFSPYQPAHPYQQLSKGLLGRKLYSASLEAGGVVEIDDFLVGPHQVTDSYQLDATAIFEVKSGGGLLRLGDKTQNIETGTVISVPAAQRFSIESQSDLPIAIRVEILGTK